MDSYKKKIIEQKKARIKEALLRFYKEEVPFELVLVIPVLYRGWECDEENYVVYTGKKEHVYINSDHGSLYVDPDYASHIDSRMGEYQSSVDAFEKAKKLLKKKD